MSKRLCDNQFQRGRDTEFEASQERAGERVENPAVATSAQMASRKVRNPRARPLLGPSRSGPPPTIIYNAPPSTVAPGDATRSFPPAQFAGPGNAFGNNSFPVFGSNNNESSGINFKPPTSFNFSATNADLNPFAGFTGSNLTNTEEDNKKTYLFSAGFMSSLPTYNQQPSAPSSNPQSFGAAAGSSFNQMSSAPSPFGFAGAQSGFHQPSSSQQPFGVQQQSGSQQPLGQSTTFDDQMDCDEASVPAEEMDYDEQPLPEPAPEATPATPVTPPQPAASESAPSPTGHRYITPGSISTDVQNILEKAVGTIPSSSSPGNTFVFVMNSPPRTSSPTSQQPTVSQTPTASEAASPPKSAPPSAEALASVVNEQVVPSGSGLGEQVQEDEAGFETSASGIPKIPRALAPSDFSRPTIEGMQVSADLDPLGMRIVALAAELSVLNKRLRDKLNRAGPMMDWTALTKWHYELSQEITAKIKAARKERARQKGITGAESSSTKRKAPEETSPAKRSKSSKTSDLFGNALNKPPQSNTPPETATSSGNAETATEPSVGQTAGGAASVLTSGSTSSQGSTFFGNSFGSAFKKVPSGAGDSVLSSNSKAATGSSLADSKQSIFEKPSQMPSVGGIFAHLSSGTSSNQDESDEEEEATPKVSSKPSLLSRMTRDTPSESETPRKFPYFNFEKAGSTTPSAAPSAPQSIFSSRATTPFSEANTSDNNTENEEDEGAKKIPQLDLSELTEDEKAENEVLFFTDKAIAQRQTEKAGAKAWEKFARGPLWILKNKESGKALIRMRLPSGATPVNYNILPKISASVSGPSKKMVLAAQSGNDGKPSSLFFSLKSSDVAEQFSTLYNSNLPSA